MIWTWRGARAPRSSCTPSLEPHGAATRQCCSVTLWGRRRGGGSPCHCTAVGGPEIRGAASSCREKRGPFGFPLSSPCRGPADIALGGGAAVLEAAGMGLLWVGVCAARPFVQHRGCATGMSAPWGHRYKLLVQRGRLCSGVICTNRAAGAVGAMETSVQRSSWRAFGAACAVGLFVATALWIATEAFVQRSSWCRGVV